MDKLHLKVLTVRFLEFCYGHSLFVHLVRTRLTYVQCTKGDASLNYFDIIVRRVVCFSVHCSLREQCIFQSVEDRTAFISLRVEACSTSLLLTNNRAFLNVGSWSPLGISILLTNDRAFLNIGILEMSEVHNLQILIKLQYCRMLSVREHLSWQFGYVWRSRFLNLASVMSGILFSYASIVFGEFNFGESKEPRETRVIKFSWKLSILQYLFCCQCLTACLAIVYVLLILICIVNVCNVCVCFLMCK